MLLLLNKSDQIRYLRLQDGLLIIVHCLEVEVDSAWLNGYEEMQHVEENDQTECQEKDQVLESDSQIPFNSNSNNHNASGCTSDEWTEDDNFHDRPTGNTDTVLHAMDFREYN